MSDELPTLAELQSLETRDEDLRRQLDWMTAGFNRLIENNGKLREALEEAKLLILQSRMMFLDLRMHEDHIGLGRLDDMEQYAEASEDWLRSQLPSAKESDNG